MDRPSARSRSTCRTEGSGAIEYWIKDFANKRSSGAKHHVQRLLVIALWVVLCAAASAVVQRILLIPTSLMFLQAIIVFLNISDRSDESLNPGDALRIY